MKRYLFRAVLVCLIMVTSISNVYASNNDIINSALDEENMRILEECLSENGTLISPMWESGDKDETNQGTHGFIAAQGLSLTASKYSNINSYFTTARKKALMVASIQPDIDGAQTLFKDHFYLPSGTGLAGYPLSAYDNFRNHYNGAVANYNAGNHTEAVRRLGMAIHYISDINQPHHASGKAAGVSRHTQYETWVEARYSSYKVTSMTSSAISAYNSKTLLTIADDSATIARNNIDKAESSATSDMDAATEITLKRAQKDAAGVIYKFCKDTGLV